MTPQVSSSGLIRLELIQWRVRALDRIKRRMAGQIPGFPLSPSDAAIYVGLIEAWCKREGLLVLTASPGLPSDVSDTFGLVSVLSGTQGRVNYETIHPLNNGEKKRGGPPPLFSNVQEGSYPPKPTEGVTYPTEPTQGEGSCHDVP
jgi:hypothetical protein